MRQASLVRYVLLSIFTETIAGMKQQRSTAAGFLRGTSCRHASLASEERQGTLTAGAGRELRREKRQSVREWTQRRVCARGSVGEKQVLPVLLKCEYVCAHVALPEKRVLFACDYWPRSEWVSECVCVCLYLAHAETGPLILLTGRRAAQSSGEIKSQIPLSLSRSRSFSPARSRLDDWLGLSVVTCNEPTWFNSIAFDSATQL